MVPYIQKWWLRRVLSDLKRSSGGVCVCVIYFEIKAAGSVSLNEGGNLLEINQTDGNVIKQDGVSFFVGVRAA